MSFDIYCFTGAGMAGILTDPDVSVTETGLQFSIDGITNDLLAHSGGTVSPNTASLYVNKVVPNSWTLEFNIKLTDLPADFTDLVNRHIFVGVTTGAGVCAGFFISAIGLAYIGGVRYTPDLQLGGTMQQIPGSSQYIEAGQYLTFRIAADDTTKTLYLYVTETDKISTTGHVLRAILPTIDANSLNYVPADATIVGLRGTATQPTFFQLDELCLASTVQIANLIPVADAGIDKSAQYCEVIKLDGSGSYDPEGGNLLYKWRLIDAPQTSMFVVARTDGRTYPIDLSGFTNKFYSPELGALLDPVVVGDVLLIGSTARTVTATGTDGSGYFLQFATQNIADNLSSVFFRVLRQRGMYQATTVSASFLPDVPGFYRFDLTVFDGLLYSDPSVVVFNIVESLLPRGVVPDVSFIFGYLSDFWGLVEDRDRITTLWSGIAQVAAGELLTLWQHDYAKSLRDIQRQFTRKWLHYDLLLPEPIPELTKVTFKWGGVYSTVCDKSVAYPYAATNCTLTIESAAFTGNTQRTVTFRANPSTPEEFAATIQGLLRSIDTRFTVQSQPMSGQRSRINIYAPIPFKIVSTTLPNVTNFYTSTSDPFFVAGSENQPPQNDPSILSLEGGRLGVPVGGNVYQIAGFLPDIVEDDLLVISGVAYRILQVTVAQTAPLRMNIVTKDPLPLNVSPNWMVASYLTSELLDFWNGLLTYRDYAYLEYTDVSDAAPSSAQYYLLDPVTVMGVNEALPSRLAFVQNPSLPFDPSGTVRVARLAKVVRRQYAPISSLVLDIPTLSQKIVIETTADEQAVLRRNVDYTLEPFRNGYAVKFVTDANTPGKDVWENAIPPDRLWAEFTYLDNNPTIEQNFGIPVEFTLDKLEALQVELDYLSAVRGLWYAYFNGPTLYNLRIGTQILLGLPFAEEAGTIEEIRTDFSPTLGRILIRDTANNAIVRSYTYPKILALETNVTTGVPYVVGNTVKQFAPLVEGAEIVDYIKDPKWFQGIINQGIFTEIEKYFKFLIKIDSAAFNLNATLSVRDFILKIKPTDTYPLFVINSGGREDDISVTDTVTFRPSMHFTEVVSSAWYGSSGQFDQAGSNGTILNQFDTDANPATAAPTFPTSDSPVLWAFDKTWLVPQDVVTGEVGTTFSVAGSADYGMCFVFGQSYTPLFRFALGASPVISDTVPLLIPNVDPSGGVAPKTGNLARLKFQAFGPSEDKNIYGTGTINVVAGALLTDTDTFSIVSGPTTTVFEFDSDGIVTPGRVAVPYTPADSVATVKASIIWAITTTQRPLYDNVRDMYYWSPNVVPTVGAGNTIVLTTKAITGLSAVDNSAVFESVANAGFTVSSVTGTEQGGYFFFYIFKNGVQVYFDTIDFINPDGSVSINISPNVPVTAGNTITIKILSGGSARTMSWTQMVVFLYYTNTFTLNFGDTVPVGKYMTSRNMSP